MKMIASVLLTLSSIASAQTATPDDYSALLAAGASAARELGAAQAQRNEFAHDADIYLNDFRVHQANQCTYPEGHPDVCAAYNTERDSLNARNAALRVRERNTAARLGIARSSFGMAMASIRIRAVLLEFEPWVQSVTVCTGLPPASQSACIGRAWERVPRRLAR